MNSFALTLILFAGVTLLFVFGSLVSHFIRLDKDYAEMMNDGGNITDTES